MAINPLTRYPTKIDNSDPSGYPYGKAKNDVVSGDKQGTPLERDWVNDVFGFFQALLAWAETTPSGTPDKVGSSQLLEAVKVAQSKAEVWTASGTWSRPAGPYQWLRVRAIGGGGGGGNDSAGTTGGGGGGSSGHASEIIIPWASVPSSVTVTVGAGGIAATDGGATSFGALLTASGGFKGADASGLNGGGGGGPSAATSNAGASSTFNPTTGEDSFRGKPGQLSGGAGGYSIDGAAGGGGGGSASTGGAFSGAGGSGGHGTVSNGGGGGGGGCTTAPGAGSGVGGKGGASTGGDGGNSGPVGTSTGGYRGAGYGAGGGGKRGNWGGSGADEPGGGGGGGGGYVEVYGSPVTSISQVGHPGVIVLEYW